MNDSDGHDYDYIDEDTIRGRARRGSNKNALKSAKGFAPAAPKSPSKCPSKSPNKSPTKGLPKAAIPRSQPTVVTDKSDWEMKLKISRKQQKQARGDNYTFEPAKTDSDEADPPKTGRATKSATPKTLKLASALGDGGAVAEEAAAADPQVGDATSKKESVEPSSAWDDEKPWG